jgi:hypothetical protein
VPAWLEWTGISEFAAALDATIARASVETRAAVAEVASEVEKLAKEFASGRPGPNVVTGTLRRGIKHDPITPWGVRGWQTELGPTAVYSRRIELGFHGTDALGRHYNQGPFPYFTPAWNTIVPFAAEIYALHWRKALMGA